MRAFAAAGRLRLDWNGSAAAGTEAVVRDARGRELLRAPVPAGSMGLELDRAGLPGGFLWVELRTGGRVAAAAAALAL
jgi:hypothetical protein